MKRNIITIGLLTLGLFATAQQKKKAILPATYVINGYVKGLQSPYIYLRVDAKEDSAKVSGGKFTYQFKAVAEPTRAYITDHLGLYETFYVEHTNVNIKGDAVTQLFVVTGGKTQNELNLLKSSRQKNEAARTELYKNYDIAEKAKDSAAVLNIEKQLKELSIEAEVLTKSFVKSNSKSYVSLDQINGMGYSTDYAELNNLYQLLDPALKASKKGKKLEATLAVLEKGSNGKKMVDFTQHDLSGKPVSFAAFRGKYVLVDFWASWCGPCRAENPNVLKAYQQFAPKGFTVIGVSLDDNAEKWKKAVEDDKMPWTQVSDLKGWKNELSTYYGIQGIPSNYLVNPEGVIIARNLRGADLEAKLAELLK